MKLEKTHLTLGFMALTDCAPLAMAVEKGLDKKYGLTLQLKKMPSWAAVRDGLRLGELDASHVLYGLVYGVELGIGCEAVPMSVLMTLNQNGQGITLSNQFKKRGVTSGEALAKWIHAHSDRQYIFAQTFATGTHALWLYYWLASLGIDPLRHIKSIVIPPPQMASSLYTDHLDGMNEFAGYCAGEPWNAHAVLDNTGFTLATSQSIWPDHPEKVLGATREWVTQHPNTARALIAVLLEAAAYCDEPAHRPEIARLLAQKAYVDAPESVIVGRFCGQYEDGLGKTWDDPHKMTFFREGAVSFPYLSDGMWFMTQFKRWGMLSEHPAYLQRAKAVQCVELYSEAAHQMGISVPETPMRTSVLMDGRHWSGSDPFGYAEGGASC